MRIAFLCSSLEPGRDGVGDYTRRLAAECIRQGHEVRLLSLNEKGEIGNRKSDFRPPTSEKNSAFSISAFQCFQESEGTEVACLRLPGSLGWPERVTLARQWVEAFNPDWVSLQFVPFGFHPKGLCFGLGKRLAAINSKARWHVMFHELWLGLGEQSPVKHRLWGAFQRSIVRDLIGRLRPRLVHTQAEPYQSVLVEEGIPAAILPLFGNIPPITGNGWDGLLGPLVAEASEKLPVREHLYLAGVFGAVHPEWNVEQTVNLLLPLVLRCQKRLVLVFFGKSNLTPEAIGQLKSVLQNRAEVVMAGEKSAGEISRILQTLDLGLATSPQQLIQKSGSVAAMVEHGLSVLVTRDDWHLRGLDLLPLEAPSHVLTLKQIAKRENLPARDLKPSGINNVKRVADLMLETISKCSL